MSAISLFNRCYWQGIRPLQAGLLTNFTIGRNQEQRCGIKKHWNPKFKWLRRKKVIEVEIPNFHEKTDEDTSKREMKRKLREHGMQPPRPWMERPFNMACTSEVMEPYVPPEGDGKRSVFTKVGAKQNLQFVEKKSKSMMAVRKIRQYDDNFDPREFAVKGQEIYVEAHEAMMAKNKQRLRELVTEKSYPEMMHNVKYTTIRWKFLQSLEPPRVVHVRQHHLVTNENIFAQVTVRLHTQQTLAIYDRFGRLMHGSEIIAKDVLEYVVFENNVSNLYGSWRMHSKIVPDWAEPKQPAFTTWQLIEDSEETGDSGPIAVSQEEAIESVQIPDGSNKTPPPAIA